MPSRLARCLAVAAGSFLFCLLLFVLLFVLLVLPAAASTPAEPPPQYVSEELEEALYVTASMTSAIVGQVVVVSATFALGDPCGFHIMEAKLDQAAPLFTYVDPPTSVITGPSPYPAVWVLRAAQTGVTTFAVAMSALRQCGYPEVAQGVGQSPAVTVITGAQVRLPAVYRVLSYLPPAPPPPPPAFTDLGTLGGRTALPLT